jgi:hypothetical protein
MASSLGAVRVGCMAARDEHGRVSTDEGSSIDRSAGLLLARLDFARWRQGAYVYCFEGSRERYMAGLSPWLRAKAWASYQQLVD